MALTRGRVRWYHRRMAEKKLIGRVEVAELLGVLRNNLSRIADLPKPVQKTRATPLWDKREIVRFAEERAARKR